MKYSLFVVLFFISGLIYSQATPQWLFPIWFEDANGDRDTVYIGYDPEAELIPGVFDEEFEDYVWVDTAIFNVLTYRDATFSPSTGLWNADSSKRIEVHSSYYFNIYINFVKGQMPITMFWDMNLFYSNDLPYPDLSPYPSGVAQIYCAAGEPGYVNCPSAFDDDPLSMTDSVNLYYEFPITSPHLFDGSGIPPYNYPSVLEAFTIDFKPYEIYNSITNGQLNSIEVYPNPFINNIHIKSDDILVSINMYSYLGQQIKSVSSINSHSISLPTEDMQKGIYYLEITTQKKIFTSIILKQ
ncbi:MAG TPA: T9SS type A sorting domain-containing protein [Chitinophagales bacterium]|nr:T9SS type A sorting domain-containing protein [Chitinophagales bacterium]